MLLRSDLDWDSDLRPVRTKREHGLTEFALPARGVPRYFKPVLVRDGRACWAQGKNLLVIETPGAVLDVFPHFDPDTSRPWRLRVTPQRAGTP